jgi:hypothetical protein
LKNYQNLLATMQQSFSTCITENEKTVNENGSKKVKDAEEFKEFDDKMQKESQ